MMWTYAPVTLLYVALTSAFAVYGANMAWYSWLSWRRAPGEPVEPLAEEDLPAVTVQVPIYNELYVSERVITAVAALDYPAHLLQIQILDDSTDSTSVIVARAVKQLATMGVDITHVRRTDRTGYKAGALAAAMETASGEFVAIFDADFTPEPDFLRRVVPHFTDPRLAFVQGRWGHLNRNYSWLTRMQALAVDAHFLVEQASRGSRGYWFNFNGTAGVWRASAIADAGGWRADTLTEDLDLSYRAHLAGWRGKFLEDVVVRGELPANMAGFRRQQHRWARGSLECAWRHIPGIWRCDAPAPVKFQATIHLASYGIHVLLLVALAIYPAVVVAAEEVAQIRTLYGFAYLLVLFSVAPSMFFVLGQHRQGRPWWRELRSIVLIAFLGPGMMMNTTRAVLEILTRPNAEFERTAKFGIGDDGDRPWTMKRYQLGLDSILVAELALGAYGVAAAMFAARHGNWGIMVFSAIFGLGLVALALLTVAQALKLRRHRSARRSQRLDEERKLAVLDLSPES